MNEETIDYRLDQIEKKLDTVTEILLQTQAQELRITALEKGMGDLKKNIEKMKDSKNRTIDRWLNPLISAFVSGLVAFIFVKVGLK